MGVILYAAMNTWKVPLIVDISMVKNWFEVYWIIESIKYTLFCWLIKEHWILSYLRSGNGRLVDGEFLGKGDFGLEKFLWDISGTTLNYLANFDCLCQQKYPLVKYCYGDKRITILSANSILFIWWKISVM